MLNLYIMYYNVMECVNLRLCCKHCAISSPKGSFFKNNIFLCWIGFGVGCLFVCFFCVLFYSISGILLKYYLQWNSHKANTEPEFPIFLNL